MSALPSIPRITQRVIQRPMYRNERLHDFNAWYRDNEPMLVQYYDDLQCFSGSDQGDQAEFFATQYDLERTAIQQAQLDAADDRASTDAWCDHDRDTGIPLHGEL